MTDHARAVIFGRDADKYEAFRPDYPPEAIAHVLSLTDPRRAVEIGAGTGKATADIARKGRTLICVEPSAQMAEVLAGKRLPGVEVVVATFEDWEGPPDPVDLVYAAQAWHWVDRTTAYEKARSLLRPGGALALMWNIPISRYGLFEEVYTQHAPELLVCHDERIKRRDSSTWLDEMSRTGFTAVSRFTHLWSTQLTGSEVKALYSTYSDHMVLPEPARSRLLSGLETAVEKMGGLIALEYRTEVFSGRA